MELGECGEVRGGRGGGVQLDTRARFGLKRMSTIRPRESRKLAHSIVGSYSMRRRMACLGFLYVLTTNADRCLLIQWPCLRCLRCLRC